VRIRVAIGRIGRVAHDGECRPRAIPLCDIVVALTLIVVGLLATYGSTVSDRIGIVAFVAATVLLLLGMVLRRI